MSGSIYPISKDFGRFVREKRQALGLSQEDIADKAEIDRTYISLIERGRVNITLGVALKIATALQLQLSKLVKSIE